MEDTPWKGDEHTSVILRLRRSWFLAARPPNFVVRLQDTTCTLFFDKHSAAAVFASQLQSNLDHFK